MFKKREKPAGSRAKDEDAGDGESNGVPVVAKKPRLGVATSSKSTNEEGGSGTIAASTKRTDSSAATRIADRSSDTTLSGWKADISTGQKPRDDAVRILDVDTEVGKDTRSMHERNQQIHKDLKSGVLEAGIYRGLGGYKQYAERSDSAISASKSTGLLGPVRGTNNVRGTLRIEWIGTSGDGGICKDYKETGYCGFGDSCKFAHDRSDYKPSYMLEKEWEAKQQAIQDKKRLCWEKRMKRKAAAAAAGQEDPDSDSDSSSASGSDAEAALPTGCPACERRWQDCKSIPITTVCGHYFCEDCAMANYAKTPKCMNCDAPTNGIFNSAEAIEDKLRQKKAQQEAKKLQKKMGAGFQAKGYNVSLEE